MCYDQGILQAYLDNEVNNKQKQEITRHLEQCAGCRDILEELQANNNFVNLHMNRYLANLPAASTVLPDGRLHNNKLKYWKKGIKIMQPYKKFLATAAMVGVLVITFSIPAVRSMAGEFLTVFRMEKVQTISINQEDIEQLERTFNEGIGQANIDNFGQVEVTGKQEAIPVTLAQAESAVDFAVKLPRPAGYAAPELQKITGSTASLTLDVANVNSLLQSLGNTALLPESLDGQTFTMHMPVALIANYPSDTGALTVIQARSPEMKAPSGVDVQAIKEALLNLPALPENLRRQLLAVDDWQHTVLIPNVNGTSREVRVNGNQGVYMDGSAQPDHLVSTSFLVWQNNGVVYSISGTNLDEQSALFLAGQMK